MTLGQIRTTCKESVAKDKKIADVEVENNIKSRDGLLSNRLKSEADTEYESFVLTPHKRNFFLPAYTTNAINKDAYRTLNGYEENLEDLEAMFQLSLKAPLSPRNMFVEGDGFFFGFTLEAWWQVYSSGISKPFRETNYQPEIYYIAPLDYQLFGADMSVALGFEHQSNGRGQDLSRSWNRIYANFLFEKENWVVSFRPWYRLPEDEKEFEFDPDGDDNPDIEDFMGHFELGAAYKWNDYEFSFQGRQNFATNNGSAEFVVSFPLWGKFRGYANAFHGYGDSLIDYNFSQTRFGLGFALNDIF
jgi:phospholipase A1